MAATEGGSERVANPIRYKIRGLIWIDFIESRMMAESFKCQAECHFHQEGIQQLKEAWKIFFLQKKKCVEQDIIGGAHKENTHLRLILNACFQPTSPELP